MNNRGNWMSTQDHHQELELTSVLTRALSSSVLENFRGIDADLNILGSLYDLLQKDHALEPRSPEKSAASELSAATRQDTLPFDRRRNELIDRFDAAFRSLPRNEKMRVYSETPGDLCDRLIRLTITIDRSLPFHNDAAVPPDQRNNSMTRIDQAYHLRSHLQQCLKQILKDLQAGTALLPPHTTLKKQLVLT